MYTNAEKRTIRRAFNRLTHLVEMLGWRASQELREALRIERKERSSIDVARALLVSAAWQDRTATAVELYPWSPGIRTAAILGAELERRVNSYPSEEHRKQLWRDLIADALEVTEIHNEAIQNRLDSIRTDLTTSLLEASSFRSKKRRVVPAIHNEAIQREEK
jgi:hypothetical protein